MVRLFPGEAVEDERSLFGALENAGALQNGEMFGRGAKRQADGPGDCADRSLLGFFQDPENQQTLRIGEGFAVFLEYAESIHMSIVAGSGLLIYSHE